MLAIKRLRKVGGCLRVLPEQLAGGEREWKRKHGAAAAMAAVRLAVARWGRGGAFIAGAVRPWMTEGDGRDARRATAARATRVRRRAGAESTRLGTGDAFGRERCGQSAPWAMRGLGRRGRGCRGQRRTALWPKLFYWCCL
jgi:hypothetical protein